MKKISKRREEFKILNWCFKTVSLTATGLTLNFSDIFIDVDSCESNEFYAAQ